MGIFTTQNLLNTVPPAIILAVGLYLVRFFGHAIADQKPFADDWEWMVELSGAYFLISFLIIPVAIGITAALQYGDYGIWEFITSRIGVPTAGWIINVFPLGHMVRLAIVAFINYRLLLRNGAAFERIYKAPAPFIRTVAEAIGRAQKSEEKYQAYLKKVLDKKYSSVWPLIMVVILAYVVALEFLGGSPYWILAIGIGAIGCLISIALDYSMASISKLPEVSVYLIGSKKPIRATLLKATKDHIRVRKDNTVIVFNRDQVVKFEMEVEAYKHVPIISEEPKSEIGDNS